MGDWGVLLEVGGGGEVGKTVVDKKCPCMDKKMSERCL